VKIDQQGQKSEKIKRNCGSKFLAEFTLDKTTLSCSRLAVRDCSQEVISRFFPIIEALPKENVSQLKSTYDKSILTNKEQLQAVQHILAGTSHPYPYILFGPPGTGKTVTLVESIKQVYSKVRDSKIIVTAQSNLATDNLAQRLVKNGFIPKGTWPFLLLKLYHVIFVILGNIIRVYSKTLESSYNIPADLKKIGKFGLEYDRKMSKYRIICLTLTMCTALVGNRSI